MALQASARPVRSIDDVEGWLRLTDQLVMDWLLGYQDRTGVRGDLLEMGAYLGKSTILIGFHRRPGERFVVCDLFGEEPPTAENRRTAAFYTKNLTREAFESNYRSFHSEPPEVLQAPTSSVSERVAPRSCRFVHIDACHLYDLVREDIDTSRTALHDDGIVVFDDIRAAHTPGVPAAVWPEVASGGLRAICITPNKLYATWGDADAVQDAMLDWLAGEEDASFEVQQVAGRRLLRIDDWRAERTSPVAPARGAPPPPRRRPRRALERLAAEALPPIVERALRKARARIR
jgi:hypothetical protein